ncbi:molecular chaperone DnaJ [Leptospira perolatii]|uniref:Molecular chaperone DnaJ n=1 Tax=Leptospira perolatii TaxID=2023191 RepID=A0A2M9ZI79_9LEPT|nr:molecular chaperone DnaJ [Leptospira perolatii]PJZ68038.1 molecular chaperone DnaJ [Leptospira perolatii]PJZ71674.1 molecular chaperone DnaJ [Leptospira perolatii]
MRGSLQGLGLNRKADYYEVLDISRDATPSEIDKAFHRYVKSTLSHSWIPWNQDLLREGSLAHYFLSDPNRRKKYDASLDYELVILDPSGVPEEFEKFFEQQKISTAKEYHRLYQQFLLLKREREDKLWSLHNTTFYFLICFCVLVLGSVALFLLRKSGFLPEEVEVFYKKWGLLLSGATMCGGYFLFRIFYINRIILKRERKREKEIHEKSTQAGP